ncbi:hypothetical protein ABW21_db0207469 [Orbilia brochopaga]|nr:hypothetical protein ABW21_db0207469 [Drechslerella brochopaga]
MASTSAQISIEISSSSGARNTDSKVREQIEETYRRLRAIVKEGIALLSDDKEANDDLAYRTLARLFTTLGDSRNMQICWAMRKRIWYQKNRDRDHELNEAFRQRSSMFSDLYSDKDDDGTCDTSDPALNLSAIATTSAIAPADSATDTPATIAMSTASSNNAGCDIMTKSTAEVLDQELELAKRNFFAVRDVSIDIRNTLEAMKAQDEALGVWSRTSSSVRPTVPAPSVSADDQSSEETPDELFSCDNCGRDWDVMEIAIHTCVDCRGLRGYDERCYQSLVDGSLAEESRAEPRLKGFHCSKGRPNTEDGHRFLEVPKLDHESLLKMPADHVPDPDSIQRDGQVGKWIPLEQWKLDLRQTYLMEQ